MTAPANILLVDDDAGVRQVVAYQLRAAGWTVEAVASGPAAQETLTRSPGCFQLVITDVRMPDMSGLELLRWSRENHPALEVILISAFGDLDVAVEAMRDGAADYLTKPVKRAELEARVQRCLERVVLVRENEALRRELGGGPLERIIGVSETTQGLKTLIRRIAPSDASVLITGESGTGKELVAKALHELSPRASRPFVTVNCGAIPSELLESELFGHERGAFTGAVRRQIGRFERASGGSLFLDEIGELRTDHQVKLLRVLQERILERVGGDRPIEVDVRVIAATHRNLSDAVAQGAFRDDLYYRLAVLPIRLSPLRDRPDDIEALTRHFVASEAQLSTGLIAALRAHAWPGNVRELKNVVERMLLLRAGRNLTEQDFVPDPIARAPSGRLEPGQLVLPEAPFSLPDLEREIVLKALEINGGNQSRTARYLGIPRHVLLYRLEKYRAT